MRIILLGGATASGKSAKALELARENNGVIINADSMQIYSGLPVLSAQPTAEDAAQTPHLLYGVVPPSQRSSSGAWMELADRAVEQTLALGRTPILVGGTGLYFMAFLGGLADIPDIPEETRAKVRALYEEKGIVDFRVLLAKMDPDGEKAIRPNDKQRLLRAFEVAEHTGKPLGYWQRQPSKRSMAIEGRSIERILLSPPRSELYAACDKRFAKMIEQGAIDEVREILKQGLDPELPAMKTIGVRELAKHIAGEWTLEEAVSAASQATRNYAKRQMTWFRNQWK